MNDRESKIAAYLSAKREKRKWTMEQVAERMGVAKSEVSRLENAKRSTLPLGRLHEWATALGVRIELFFWEGDEKSPGLVELSANVERLEDRELLAQVAATMPYVTPDRRNTLIAMLKGWRESGTDGLKN